MYSNNWYLMIPAKLFIVESVQTETVNYFMMIQLIRTILLLFRKSDCILIKIERGVDIL